MKARGKEGRGIGFAFAGNGKSNGGGLSQSSAGGRKAFDGCRGGVSSDDAAAAAAERKRNEALAKLEAFGKET